MEGGCDETHVDALEAGTGTLTLEYRRSWETTASVEQTRSVDVAVQ